MMTDDVMNPESTFGVSDVAWRGVVGVDPVGLAFDLTQLN